MLGKSWLSIRAKLASEVKTLLGIGAIALSSAFFIHSTRAADRILPPIEAETFTVIPIRSSESQKTHLFNHSLPLLPTPGKLLLLRRGLEPIQAVRVLKQYPDAQQFAAKRVRRYGNHRSLTFGAPLTAVEKTSELSVPFSPSAEDQAELFEIETAQKNNPASPVPKTAPLPTPPPAPTPRPVAPVPRVEPKAPKLPDLVAEPELSLGELDALESPTPESPPLDSDGLLSKPTTSALKSNDDFALDVAETETEAETQTEVSEASIVVDEYPALMRQRQGVTLSYALHNNYDAQGRSKYYSGFQLKYGLDVLREVFWGRSDKQDSLTLEGGFSYYSVSSFTEDTDDSYVIVPLLGQLRYNIHFSETFTLVFYGGMMLHVVLLSENPTDTGLTYLPTAIPAFGTGGIFRFGPQWYLRADVGIESIALGVMLRF